MATKKAIRGIGLLRLGNPWLVGKHVNRIVPVYSLHNVLAPNFEKDSNFQAAKDLTQNAEYAAAALGKKIAISKKDYPTLEQTAFGILSPERRIFGKYDKKSGSAKKCADPNGAPFPLIGGLSTTTPSDDGLGRRVRELMEQLPTDWQDRLDRLCLPGVAPDPVTAFAFAVLESPPGRKAPREKPIRKEKLTGLSCSVAQFIDALILDTQMGDRVPAIRNLAYGIYMGAVVHMVSGPAVSSGGDPPLVVAYAGLPPGDQNDPVVRLAIKSYQDWISGSWHSTIRRAAKAIDRVRIKKSGSAVDDLKTRLNSALATQISSQDDRLEVVDALESSIKKHASSGTEKWLSEAAESESIGFSQHELSRRVRGLGTSIGLVGPDRGYGSARLLFDTPLLGVLVRGIVRDGRMSLDDFVSLLATQLGIVLGPGFDDELVSRIPVSSTSGLDNFELLKRNQDLLRERLLRVGLARSYSDSHTEVFADA